MLLNHLFQVVIINYNITFNCIHCIVTYNTYIIHKYVFLIDLGSSMGSKSSHNLNYTTSDLTPEYYTNLKIFV